MPQTQTVDLPLAGSNRSLVDSTYSGGPERKKSTKTKKIVIAVVVLVVLLAGILALRQRR